MAQSRPADRYRTRNQPLTLAALGEYGGLAGFVAPNADFDPNGAWKHTYRLWLVAQSGLTSRPAGMHYRGFLEIDRRPAPGGQEIMLGVYQSVLQQAPAVHDTAIELTCAADALAGPRRWKLTHTVRDGRLKPVPGTRVEQTGKIGEGSVEIRYGDVAVTRPREPGPLTSNWSLFDAVQRLPRGEAPPLEFTMLQELDLVKKTQQLAYCGAADHDLNGKTVRLHQYQHVGEGILPYHYYTDEQGRLLVAVGGLRAYVFDPNVRQLHRQCLASIAQRAKP